MTIYSDDVILCNILEGWKRGKRQNLNQIFRKWNWSSHKKISVTKLSSKRKKTKYVLLHNSKIPEEKTPRISMSKSYFHSKDNQVKTQTSKLISHGNLKDIHISKFYLNVNLVWVLFNTLRVTKVPFPFTCSTNELTQAFKPSVEGKSKVEHIILISRFSFICGTGSHLTVVRGRVFCRELNRKRCVHCTENSLLTLCTSLMCNLLCYHISTLMSNTVLIGNH